ncbi:MAG TPA: ABC transporter substrate-binding protein [Jatrophihabitans sp.]|nr:ABC transporter substrate-binding protein [Jatrophihabitans sp.]
MTGKDNSGTMPFIADQWNASHPNEKVTIKQQSDQADQQLSDLEQHFQAKDTGYDVVTVDVIWTAEFAAKGWLVPLKDSYNLDTSQLLPATVKAATYNGTLFAAPYASDGGLLYYRKDIVPTPPTTWDQMISDCQGKTTSGTITGPKPACYAGQFAKYEGLTVNAAEAINAAGGQIVKDDGKTPNVDTPEAAKGLDFLVNGFKQGYIPKEALGFQETQSLNAFQAGQLVFMRNWPYADAILAGQGSKVAGKFGIAPLPGPDGHGASSLGGHSVAISQYSKHKATDIDFLKFLESDKIQRNDLTQGTLAPVISSLYNDPALVAKFPYLPTLLASIQTAVPRPVTPFYPAVTEAIETNAYAALQGSVSTKSALSSLQSAIQSATSG